jgi:hypothetical protein
LLGSWLMLFELAGLAGRELVATATQNTAAPIPVNGTNVLNDFNRNRFCSFPLTSHERRRKFTARSRRFLTTRSVVAIRNSDPPGSRMKSTEPKRTGAAARSVLTGANLLALTLDLERALFAGLAGPEGNLSRRLPACEKLPPCYLNRPIS